MNGREAGGGAMGKGWKGRKWRRADRFGFYLFIESKKNGKENHCVPLAQAISINIPVNQR